MNTESVIARQQGVEQDDDSAAQYIEQLSDCKLMASALRHYHEQAVQMLSNPRSEFLACEMIKLIAGADSLMRRLQRDSELSQLDTFELKLVWNKLRNILSSTYYGSGFLSPSRLWH